jgi:hypothetical protein
MAPTHCPQCNDEWAASDYGLDVLYDFHEDGSTRRELQWVPCCTLAQSSVNWNGWAAFYGRTLDDVLWDHLGTKLEWIDAGVFG